MAEALPNASGLGLPIVMTVANRALGAPINIWNDHSDALSQRDAGWIQLFASSNQEAADLHVQAFALAERLSLPVMVCMDGFVLTHAIEEIDVPDQDAVDAFLPPFHARQWLDPDHPVTIGAMVGPEAFTEVKYLMAQRQLRALDEVREVADSFAEAFGRPSGGLVHPYRTDDADVVVVALGSVVGSLAGCRRRPPRGGSSGGRPGDHLLPTLALGRGSRSARGRRPGSWSSTGPSPWAPAASWGATSGSRSPPGPRCTTW